MPEDFRYAGSLDRPIYSLHFVDIILTFGLIHFVQTKQERWKLGKLIEMEISGGCNLSMHSCKNVIHTDPPI